MNTAPTVEYDEKTKELFNHNIQCPDNKILKQYKIIREWYNNPQTFHYQYECIDNPNLNNEFINKQTQLNDYGDGKYVYLDRHDIECPSTHALSKIHLTGQADTDPKEIRYNYRCTDANITKLTEHNTGYMYDGNEHLILDRPDIRCPDNSALNSVRLRRPNPRPNDEDIRYRFEYKCGSTNFISTPDNFYQNSDNVDDKNSGHIKPHIQSLILYYGLFKKNIDFDATMSRGGELSTNLIDAIREHVKSTGADYVWAESQSASWCPLIWKALQLSGREIKHEWTVFAQAQHLIDDLAQQFSEMPGWAEYADYILTTYQDPGFDNSFDSGGLQNESKKIKLLLKLRHASNIDNKQNGHINVDTQNIIKYYANGNKIDNPEMFNSNKNTKDIFDRAAIFNESEQSHDTIFVPLIWKALQLSGYFIPDKWTIYEQKQSQAEQEEFNSFAERLSGITGFAEFALLCILDNIDFSKYNMHDLEWKYISHQNDVIDVLNKSVADTELTTREQTELLYKIRVHSMLGGKYKEKYKEKYLKYKQKYIMLKSQLKK